VEGEKLKNEGNHSNPALSHREGMRLKLRHDFHPVSKKGKGEIRYIQKLEKKKEKKGLFKAASKQVTYNHVGAKLESGE